ncbi:TfoX/Sxy family protein [uncultured Ruthenibacterium sp.]|uniref:TfoX/Sxy family protein n=1 Tax=uncultured Ruthenibacterium sp. TaxID=1905347 RepID=UPI00349EE31F
MASHPNFVNYVVEQLRAAGNIRSRKMFGEYGLYCDDLFFGVICDDQFFVKITLQGQAAFPDLPKAPPYEGAKDSFLIEDVDDQERMTTLVRITCEALKNHPPKKGRRRTCLLIIKKSIRNSICRPKRPVLLPYLP